eukprot:jgi/Botrbrau1/18864/Bobra.177_2s0024.1
MYHTLNHDAVPYVYPLKVALPLTVLQVGSRPKVRRNRGFPYSFPETCRTLPACRFPCVSTCNLRKRPTHLFIY